MLRIKDEIAGDPLEFYYAESREDARDIYLASLGRKVWALDTESTGLNPYQPNWQLRTFQFGDSRVSYVLAAKYRRAIERIITRRGVQWIGHNGPHDIRSIDEFLGYDTGVICAGETYLPAHYRDSRKRDEGGIGHELKELAIALVDPSAGKWETTLKRKFKTIRVPTEGVYKSGPKKGQPKTRAARISEGWSLIAPTDSDYIAYAASDPILTFRVWQKLRNVARNFRDLYEFDHRVQLACDRLNRRGMRLDVNYTRQLSEAYTSESDRLIEIAESYGCKNIFSGAQLAGTLLQLGVELTETTPTGKLKTDDKVIRPLLQSANADVAQFVRAVLGAKQMLKRRESYTDQMLAEMDANGRVHPSINSIAARTTRMSVSRPPLQQLPTKDREDELDA